MNTTQSAYELGARAAQKQALLSAPTAPVKPRNKGKFLAKAPGSSRSAPTHQRTGMSGTCSATTVA